MKRELARLIVAQVCLHACMTGMRMAAPLLALRNGHSAAAVGLLLALFAVTQVFLAVPAGRFADRHGLKRPMAIGVLMGSVGAGAAAIWPVFPVLCLCAMLTGGAAGGAVIALQRHVGRLVNTHEERKMAFSWLSIGPAFSNFVGPFTAGVLIDLAGFQWAYAAMAALPLLAWWRVRTIRELPAVQPSAQNLRAWDLLKAPTFRNVLLVNWFLQSCWDVHTFVVPILGNERHLSASAIGSILGAFAISAAVVRLMLPLIAARLPEWKVMAISMWLTALLLLLYPFTDSAWTMGLCSVLLALPLGSVQPMVMSTLHQITPPARQGEALGLRLMTINLSSVLMPMVFGAAGAVIGVSSLFWCVSAVVTVGSRHALLLKGHKTSE